MKESFEDKLTKRIRDVMEHYEQEYSSQAWEEFRQQMPASKPWWKRVFLRYRYWLSGITLTGALIVIVRILTPAASDKEVMSVQGISGPDRFHVSEKTKITVNSERAITEIHSNERVITGIHSDTETPTTSENAIFSAEEPNDSINNSLSVALANSNQIDYPGYVMSHDIRERSARCDLLKVKEFSRPVQSGQLIPTRFQPEKVYVNKSVSFEKSGKFKLQLPAFNSLTKGSKAYNRFVGPNRLALFYSPEIHQSDSLKTIGISHGLGISLEGPIHQSVLLSIGVSFQAMNYDKTISSVKVPVRDIQVPSDTTAIPQYTDSLEIRSGTYKFIELPISVSYKFIESEKSQVWMGAGISSIAFLGQKYVYETKVGGISSSTSVSVNPWKNIYPLASLNLSLLYRYRLSDRLSLHGSIQYKQHLTEMGYNSMKLNRLNMQIGLAYRFGRED